MKNVIVNFSVSEEKICSVEVEGLGDYEWIGSVISNDSEIYEIDDEYDFESDSNVIKVLKELKECESEFGEEDSNWNECHKEFFDKVKENNVDGCYIKLVVWNVECDLNVGVIISKD